MLDCVVDSAFSALLLRLTWPDPMVRIVTAKNVAKRLSEDTDRLLPIFLKWLEARTLEVEVVNAIVILGMSGTHSKVSYSDLKQVINAGSVLSYNLLSELYADAIEDYDWVYSHSGTFSEDFSSDEHFDIIWNRQPLLGVHIFKKLAKKQGFLLKEQWAWEWKKHVSKGHPYSFGDYYFRPSTARECKAHLTPIALDVSLSALLRTLSYAIQFLGMPVESAGSIADEIVPIYLDVHEASNGIPPGVWGSDNNAIKVCLQEIIQKNPEIVYLSGPWTWSGESDPVIDVSVKAVVVPIKVKLPTAEDLWSTTVLSYNSSNKGVKWSFSDKLNEEAFVAIRDQIKEKELDCIPAVIERVPNEIPLWTLPAMLRGYCVPYSFNDNIVMEIKPSGHGVDFVINDTVVGRQVFWLKNWFPSFVVNLSPRIGTTVTLNTDYIKKNVISKKRSLRYLYKITSLSRDSGYGDYVEKIEFGFLDLSNDCSAANA